MEKELNAVYEVTEVSRVRDGSGKDYPAYGVARESIGLYRSLEDAAALVRSRAGDGCSEHDETVFYSIRLRALDCPTDADDAMEEYLYDGSGALLDSRTEPFSSGFFQGRDPEECRFRPGDLCEVLHGGRMVLGIVAATPFSRKEMELRRAGGVTIFSEDRDACQVILALQGGRYGSLPLCMDILSMIKPRYGVHPSAARRMRRLLDENRTSPVRHAIATAAREARLRSVIGDASLDPVSVAIPELSWDDFYIHLRTDGLKGVPCPAERDEVVIRVDAGKIDRHLDELRVALSRIAGNPVPGRGFRLKRDDDFLDWMYYF